MLNAEILNNVLLDMNIENSLNESQRVKFNTRAKANITDDKLKDLLTLDNNMLPYIKSKRKKSIIITPFISEMLSLQSQIERYNKKAITDSLNNGEAPITNNSMYINISGYSGTSLERDISFIIQLNWLEKAELVVFYTDYGITKAMESMLNFCLKKHIRTEIREIGKF